MNKSITLLLLLFAVCTIVMGNYFVSKRHIVNHSVVLTDEGFVPEHITIKKYDTITFTTTRSFPFWPASDSHPSHSRYPTFDPKKQVEQDANWTFEFTEMGQWRYHDHLNSTLRGTVTVNKK